MAAATDLTFILTPPRRPSLDDLGSATLEDHAAFPPNKRNMPYADQMNQWAKQLERLCSIVPVATFSVAFSGGTPGIVLFNSMRTDDLLGTFIVTDNGTGDTTISWSTGRYPTAKLKPMVTLNEDVAAEAPVAFQPTADSVRVKTRNGAGTLTDIAFTVCVF